MAKCPYCHMEVALNSNATSEQTRIKKETDGVIKKEVMYSCPHCESILGFAFFLGGMFTPRP